MIDPLAPTLLSGIDEALARRGGRRRAELERVLTAHLRDPNSTRQVATIRAAYDALRTEAPSEDERLKRGALGVFLLVYDAEAWVQASVRARGARPDPARRKAPPEADALLADRCVLDALCGLYALPESIRRVVVEAAAGEAVRLHAVGTTSMILRLPTRPLRALKLVKPQYFNHPTILHQTEAYFETYRDLPAEDTAEVYASGPRYILMQFVEGRTLREFFADVVWASGAADLDALRRMFAKLLAGLEKCEARGIHHGDLSPDNVLVSADEQDRGSPWRVHLIDFGTNFTLIERVGTIDEFYAARMSVAPESLEQAVEPSAAGDVYSLGIMLAEGLLGGDFDPVDIRVSVDKVYQRYAGMGAILDDLLDADPARRGLDTRAETRQREASVYRALEERISSELTVAERVYDGERKLGWQALSFFMQPLLPAGMREVSIWWHRGQRALFEGEGREYIHVGLVSLGVLCVGLYLFILDRYKDGLFATLGATLDALGAGCLGGAAGPSCPDLGPGWTALAGTTVATLFALLACKYYLNIFSGLSASGVSAFAQFTMRLNAVSFAVPVLLVIRDPHTWLVNSAAGVGMVTLNNFACARLASRARRVMEAHNLRVTPEMDVARVNLHLWWATSAIYSLILLSLGILLSTGLGKDEAVYAVVVLLQNLTIYVLYCSLEAPRMRTSLSRFIWGHRRAIGRTPRPGGRPEAEPGTQPTPALSG